MSWLTRLIGRKPPLNPEEYEQVRCGVCGGKGLVARYDPRVMHRCWKCHGKGYVMVPRATEQLRDAAVASQPVTMHDEEAGVGVSVTAIDTRGGSSDLPDAPTAPTAPSPPKSLDEV